MRLEPQKSWEINQAHNTQKVLKFLEEIQKDFNNSSKTKVSITDLIVLAATAAIEDSIKKAGLNIEVPFNPGYVDASLEQTDINSFKFLEPIADAFINYIRSDIEINLEEALIDKAHQLNLTVPQMSVLYAGLRSLGVVYDNQTGILTQNEGILSNDFFVNLLDMDIEWLRDNEYSFTGVDRKSQDKIYKASRSDLIFAANSELKAQAQYYAQDDTKEQFIKDFIEAWVKVMQNDRFDLN